MAIIRHDVIIIVISVPWPHPHRELALVLKYKIDLVIPVLLLLINFRHLGQRRLRFLQLARWLNLLLVNRIVVAVLDVLDVESLEIPPDAQMLEIVRAQGELGDDNLDEVICQLKLLEHLDEIFLGDCLWAIFDFFESVFELLRILGCHLSDAHQSLFFLFLVGKIEFLYDFLDFLQKNLSWNTLFWRHNCLFEYVLQKCRGVFGLEEKWFCFQHWF